MTSDQFQKRQTVCQLVTTTTSCDTYRSQDRRRGASSFNTDVIAFDADTDGEAVAAALDALPMRV